MICQSKNVLKSKIFMKMRRYVELVFPKDLISTVYSGENEVLLGEATK